MDIYANQTITLARYTDVRKHGVFFCLFCLFITFFIKPAMAQNTSAITQAALLLDGLPTTPSGQVTACSLLTDNLGGILAIDAPDSSGQSGLMGAPITCARMYDSGDSNAPMLVAVYTDPNIVKMISSGPPPGQQAKEVKIQGKNTFILPANNQGRMSAVLIDLSPHAAITIPLSNQPGTEEKALKLLNDMNFDAFEQSDTSMKAEPSNAQNGEETLADLSSEIKNQLENTFDDLFSNPDISLDPVSKTPRCLDIGEFLEAHPTFIYASLLIGKECTASQSVPTGGKENINNFTVEYEPSEQSFSGDYATRGFVILSEYAMFYFQIDGEQKDVSATLKAFDLSRFEPLL